MTKRLVEEIVPFVKKNCHAVAKKSHRSITGLSMGANRTPELDASLQGLRRQVTRFTGLHVEILTV